MMKLLDYGFRSSNWSHTTSVGIGVSCGSYNIGIGGSYTIDIASGQSNWDWGVSAGYSVFNNPLFGMNINVGYGSSGFNLGINGKYDLTLKSRFLSFGALPGGTTDVDGRLIKSNETLQIYNETYYSEATYYDAATHIYDSKVRMANTSPKPINGKYLVSYGDRAFRNPLSLWIAMGHEYVHVSQLSSGLKYRRALLEGGANKWLENAANASGKSGKLMEWILSGISDNNKWIKETGMTRQTFNSELPSYTPGGKNNWGLPTSIPSSIIR